MPRSGNWAINYHNLQRMDRATRLAKARQQQRLARAADRDWETKLQVSNT